MTTHQEVPIDGQPVHEVGEVGEVQEVMAPLTVTRTQRATDVDPTFPPADVPLHEALDYARPDPVTRLRRVLSVGDTFATAAVVGVSLVLEDPAAIVPLLLMMTRLWRANDRVKPSHLLSAQRTGKRSLALIGLVATVYVFTPWMPHPRRTMAALTLLCLFAIAWRLALRWPRVRGLVRGDYVESLLLIGDFPAAAHTIKRWEQRRATVRVVGVILTDAPDGIERRTTVEGIDVVGQLIDTAPAACQLGVSKVLVVGDDLDSPTLRRIGWELGKHGIPVAVATQIEGIRAYRSRVDIIGDQTIVELAALRRRSVVSFVWAGVDRVVAALLLLLLLPLLAVLVVAVRWESPGPAIFRQIRTGQYGRPFTLFKLRTMRTDAEELKSSLAELNESDGVLFKMRRDPRVTRLGRFLRSSSLDELPQLVNVLRGEMALIGPRPHVLAEADAYDAWSQRRLLVKPGLSGLWQVSGRSNLGWEEAVAHDLDYVDNWHPGLDVRIAARTLRAVLRRDGAY